MTHDIDFSREKHLGIVTLNRPHSLNALTLTMIKAFYQQLEHWRDDPRIHAVVIRAVEGRAFCAGGDVRWLYDAGLRHDPEQLQFFWHEYRLNQLIHSFEKPFIALMDGVTMGGGVGISLHGSHPVASERFVFAMPETSIGFFPDIGASYLLSRCPGAFGMYLGLTGNRLDAHAAHALELVRYVVPSIKFTEIVGALGDADLSVEPHQQVAYILNRVSIHASVSPIQDIVTPVNHCFSGSSVESILSALEESDDEWHAATRKGLLQKSPLSLKITFEQLKRATSLSLAECLNMDYGLVQHFMSNHDFYEGVRALLVDKDRLPKWKPCSLEAVLAGGVESYFAVAEKKINVT